MMMSMATIAGPRRGLLSWSPMIMDHVVVDAAEKQSSFGKSTRASSCTVVRALRVQVRGRRVGRTPPGLNVKSARASPLLFRALPEDGVAVEAAGEVSADPIAETPAYEGPTVKVKFELQKECHFGQQFKVVGGDSLFGDWDPSAALPLTWSKGHLWTAEVVVPEGKKFEYKYVLTGQEGEIEWQPGFNQVLETAAGAELLVISVAWEEIQSEPTVEPEVQPAELEAESAEPKIPFAELEAESAEPKIPFAELEAETTEPESQSAEPESQSVEPESRSVEPVSGDSEAVRADAQVSTPADALADVAASAVVGALNAGLKAATAIEGTVDALPPVSQPPSSETNGVAESKAEETPTAIELPVVNAALAATAEPAAPVEEPQSTNNGTSTSTSNQAESAATEEEALVEEKPLTEGESKIEEVAQQQPRIDKQQLVTEEPKKRFNPFQKDLEWLSKTLFVPGTASHYSLACKLFQEYSVERFRPHFSKFDQTSNFSGFLAFSAFLRARNPIS